MKAGGPVGSARGASSTHSGLPACDDEGFCNSAVGIAGDFAQCCEVPDSGWISLAFPVQTDGATLYGIRMTHATNVNGGDLYLMDDTDGNPDITKILYTGCNQIREVPVGELVYAVDPPVVSGSITWVVAVFRSSMSFDVAFTDDGSGGTHTNLGFQNVIGTGALGEWEDLSLFGLGYCYCVEVFSAPIPGACCNPYGFYCAGDANRDGVVDPLDSNAIELRFGLDPCNAEMCQYDVNNDGVLDPLDTGFVRARFGVCDPPIQYGPCGAECSIPPQSDEPPENDHCADAISVSVNRNRGFNNSLATTDGPVDCDEFTGHHDLWYELTAPSEGVVLISMCDEDTTFDTTLSVYSGTSCPVGPLVACSDDDCGQVGGASELVIAVSKDEQLKIRVGGWFDGSCEADPIGWSPLNMQWVASGHGACCIGDDDACIIATAESCAGTGGTYQGDGTACTYDQCP
ncbi:MAG: hypothetical protein IID37_06455 [Planctomycetes bacterium]|nr:hypothetical protein [Planctomycetota bacterium]